MKAADRIAKDKDEFAGYSFSDLSAKSSGGFAKAFPDKRFKILEDYKCNLDASYLRGLEDNEGGDGYYGDGSGGGGSSGGTSGSHSTSEEEEHPSSHSSNTSKPKSIANKTTTKPPKKQPSHNKNS
mgnify:CR=1 FL=1